MYTKSQYLKDVKKYDFKKYKVEVIAEGDCANNLILKVMLNDLCLYQTNKGAFVYKEFKNGAFFRTKWFIKYRQFNDVKVSWKNNKDFIKFTSWCSNYRVQNDIKEKFQQALNEFNKNIQYNEI